MMPTLGGSVGQCTKQCGLACVRITDKSHVRNGFQLQIQVLFLPFRAGLEFLRGAVDGSHEVGVAEAAFAAFGRNERLVRLVEIAQQIACRGVEDQRPDRDLDDTVFSVDAVHLASASVSSGLCLPQGLVAQRHEALLPRDGLDDDGSAVAAVTAVRAAERHEFFTAETGGS